MLPNPYNDLLVISITGQYQVHQNQVPIFADLRASDPVKSQQRLSACRSFVVGSPADLQLGRPTPGVLAMICALEKLLVC